MDQDATWCGSRPRPRRQCVRWTQLPPRKGAQQPPFFGQCLLWPNDRLSQQLLSFYVTRQTDIWSVILTAILHTPGGEALVHFACDSTNRSNSLSRHRRTHFFLGVSKLFGLWFGVAKLMLSCICHPGLPCFNYYPYEQHSYKLTSSKVYRNYLFTIREC